MKVTARGKAVIAITGALVGVATANVGWGVHANAATHSPSRVGSYRLVVDAPVHPNEDELGWNCFVDGNGWCGYSIVRATGFVRRGWTVTCVWVDGEVVNGGRYVMCDDGSVYVKAQQHRR